VGKDKLPNVHIKMAKQSEMEFEITATVQFLKAIITKENKIFYCIR